MLTRLRRFNLMLASLLLLVSLAHAAPSMDDDQTEARRKIVLEEQQALGRAQDEVNAWKENQQKELKSPLPSDVTLLTLEQAQVETEAARVQLESAGVDRQTIQHTVQELQAAIHELEDKLQQLKSIVGSKPSERSAREQQIADVQQTLSEKRALLEFESQRLQSRQAARSLAEERLSLTKERLKVLQELHRVQEEHSRQVALEDLKASADKEQQAWLAKATKLRTELESLQPNDPNGTAQRSLIETLVQDAEARARLSHLGYRLAQIENKLEGANALSVSAQQPPEVLKSALEQITALVSELSSTQALLARKVSVLQQQQQVIKKRQLSTSQARKQNLEERPVIGQLIGSLKESLTDFSTVLD
jgi:chromosome segregation ATPase